MALGDDVREHDRQIATLLERIDRAARDLLDGQLAMKNALEQIHRLEGRALVLEDRVADLRKDREERERKSWTLILATIGSALALIANIIVT